MADKMSDKEIHVIVHNNPVAFPRSPFVMMCDATKAYQSAEEACKRAKYQQETLMTHLICKQNMRI